MRPNLLMTIILPQLISCQSVKYENEDHLPKSEAIVSGGDVVRKVSDIALPFGFTRISATDNSFASWLRDIQLKKDARVFLYNGRLKVNQAAQFAVLDIPVGNKDLQQCADAIMRLRAQYLYDSKRYNEIWFADNNGTKYQFEISNREPLNRYLEKVYSYCGTLSLARQLKKVSFHDMNIGDVFIRGGSPGHATIVVDMAVNQQGKKIYLLAQSYMPAQDIHILKNPMDDELNPWYRMDNNVLIYTPEWTFTAKELKTW